MKTYIVFGMHRSGTSFLAHALKDQGVNIGKEILGPGVGNLGGYFENVDFLHFNDLLLTEAGGNWASVPDEKKIVEGVKKHEKEFRKLLAENKDEFWGFKDPRTSLTIRAIVPYILELDDDPFLYVCFRRPEKVADSLFRRDKMPMEEGKKLAIQHNQRIIKFLEDLFVHGRL